MWRESIHKTFPWKKKKVLKVMLLGEWQQFLCLLITTTNLGHIIQLDPFRSTSSPCLLIVIGTRNVVNVVIPWPQDVVTLQLQADCWVPKTQSCFHRDNTIATTMRTCHKYPSFNTVVSSNSCWINGCSVMTNCIPHIHEAIKLIWEVATQSTWVLPRIYVCA